MSSIFERLKWIHQKLRLTYTLPFFVLISYTLLGAAIFRNLELERDVNERETFRNSYNYATDQVLRRMLEVRCYDVLVRMDERLQMHYANEALRWFMDYLNLTSVIKERNDSSPWSWYGSMFYAGQLYTTIGYGLPVAKTRAGQIASIFYIMMGIPIFLIILKDVGRLLSRACRKLYKRLRTARSKLPGGHLKRLGMPVKALYTSAYSIANSVASSDQRKLTRMEMDVEMGIDEQNEFNKKLSRENSFPIPIALAMLVLWIGLSAGLFCLWETEWGYMTSVYFFFVSISTVGLGDIVPANKDMMLLNFVLILIGLALLSMCINLIQGAIERMIDQLLQQYIEEIERVAAIVQGGDGEYKEEGNIEIGITADLMSVPFVQQQKSMWSFPRTAKDWLAEKIANNLISSRLKSTESDEESDDDDKSSYHSLQHPRLSITKPRIGGRLLQSSRLAIKAVQAIEKARLNTTGDDFHSTLFSKFVTSSKLEKLVEQIYEDQPTTASKAVQTEPILKHLLASPEFELTLLEDSKFSSNDDTTTTPKQFFSSASTFEANDADSVISKAYYDVKFDDTYAEPHTSSDRISQLLKRSQLSLEAAAVPGETGVNISYCNAPTARDGSVCCEDRIGDVVTVASSSLHRLPHFSSVLCVPYYDFKRSHPNPSSISTSSSSCHTPSCSKRIRIPLHQKAYDRTTLNRLRYHVGILPADFETSFVPIHRRSGGEQIPQQQQFQTLSANNRISVPTDIISTMGNNENEYSCIDNLLGTVQFEDTFYCT